MTFKEHEGTINCVQFSPDSRWVASGGSEGALKIWDISTGKVLSNFYLPGQGVTCLEYNP
jgi:katanin p80 WD40 repeat-containing subunit B1